MFSAKSSTVFHWVLTWLRSYKCQRYKKILQKKKFTVRKFYALESFLLRIEKSPLSIKPRSPGRWLESQCIRNTLPSVWRRPPALVLCYSCPGLSQPQQTTKDSVFKKKKKPNEPLEWSPQHKTRVNTLLATAAPRSPPSARMRILRVTRAGMRHLTSREKKGGCSQNPGSRAAWHSGRGGRRREGGKVPPELHLRAISQYTRPRA